MKRERFSQIRVIESESAKAFQDQFNSTMEELASKAPTFKFLEGDHYRAVITYEEVKEIIDSVADEFHLEGIYYLCKHCPYLDDPHDKRIKRCTCKYSPTGIAFKDNEACEFFYKQLKQNNITPLEDYMR